MKKIENTHLSTRPKLWYNIRVMRGKRICTTQIARVTAKEKEKEMDAIDKIIERIKKAVRLANKTTEAGERETAMRLARNLAEKNGIAFDEIEIEREAVGSACQEEDGELKPLDMAVDGRIGGVLRNHFAVVMMMHLYKSRRKVRYTYFGSHLNIDIAKYVADILRREARKAWRNAKKDAERGFFSAPPEARRLHVWLLLQDSQEARGKPHTQRPRPSCRRGEKSQRALRQIQGEQQGERDEAEVGKQHGKPHTRLRQRRKGVAEPSVRQRDAERWRNRQAGGSWLAHLTWVSPVRKNAGGGLKQRRTK